MAKPKAKQAATAAENRRAKLATFESDRKKQQRNRTIKLLSLCVVLAVALLAYPVYLFVDDIRMRSTPLAEIGATVEAAGCSAEESNPATGNQVHVADGTAIPFERFPPDSGPHYNSWAPFAKKFYTMEDRPAIGNLAHNLEHGYLIVWYRDGMPADQVKDLKAISRTFTSNDLSSKFIAAPWTEADGAPFPEGKNVVLARWFANPNDPGNVGLQKGIRLACGQVSGQVVKDFMAKHPATSAPEPNGG